jgi:hypothetical protein
MCGGGRVGGTGRNVDILSSMPRYILVYQISTHFCVVQIASVVSGRSAGAK